MRTIAVCGLVMTGLVLAVVLGTTSTGRRVVADGGVARLPSDETPRGPSSPSAPLKDDPGIGQPHPLVVSLLSALRAETDPNRREELIRRAAESVPDADLRAVLNALVGDKDPAVAELSQLLTRRWAEKDPQATAVWAEQLPGEAFKTEALRQVAVAWANIDLTAAVAWAQGLPEDRSKAAALTSLAYEASRTEPLIALELMRTRPPTPERDDLLVHAVSQWAGTDCNSAVQWALSVADPNLHDRLVAAVVVAGARQDGHAAAEAVATLLAGGPEQERAAVAVAQRWAQQSPRDAGAWTSQFPEGSARDAAIQNVISIWRNQDGADFEAWLQRVPDDSLRGSGAASANQGAGTPRQ